MEKRRVAHAELRDLERSHNSPIPGSNYRDLEDVEEYEDSIEEKEKYALPRGAMMGIWISTILLAAFLFFITSQLDIIHVALSHESTYHANHIAENHVERIIGKPLMGQEMKSQPLQAQTFIKPSTSDNDPGKVVKVPKAPPSVEISLEEQVKQQIAKVHAMKFEQHVVMEKDPAAKKEISNLQSLLRSYIPQKYGPEPYVVAMTLQFPEVMHGEDRPDQEVIHFELGPLSLVPYSTYKFLEIMETFQGGNFHRRAGHVLQAMVRTKASHLAFQEYHPGFPHVKHTLGYAGRPGGPEFYISTVDNSQNHGPASQGSATEADSCFGKIIDNGDVEVVQRMKTQPGAGKGSGFISDSKNFIKIVSLKLAHSEATN